MKKFNFKKFKDNYIFLLISTSIVVLFLIISLLLNKNSIIKEKDLETSGEENISKLVINEYQSNNKGTYMASDGGIYDWIEIYNGKSQDINLTNYSLSDNNTEIKWVFPKGTIIKANDYLVVFLCGKNTEGLMANFKLASSGGENIILRSASKKVVDAVQTLPLTSNQVMARDLDGAWQLYNMPTPGEINTLEGYEKYMNNITESDSSELIINEVLVSNQANFVNKNGKYSGYIELKNNGKDVINLKEYTISNDESRPFRYNLPNKALSGGEIFLIFTSGENSYNNDEYSASFNLEKNNGVIILARDNKIVDKAIYENIQNGIALVKEKDSFVESSSLSAGFNNNNEGITAFQKKYMKMPDELVISEVLTNNFSLLPHNGGKYYDLIELYNNTNKTINLKDYCLSKKNGTCTTSLPEMEMKSHTYYTLMASGNSNLSTNEYKHINIKISNYDTLYLFKKTTIVDAMFIPEIDIGSSYGRNKDYGYGYFSDVTPNKSNSNGSLAVSLPPTINTPGGIYNNSKDIKVELIGEGAIYYTTDGSNPTSGSTKYNKPISLTKTTVLKAVSIGTDKKKSNVTTASYIINENHTLPVMSLSIEPSDFKNIQSNAWEVGLEESAYSEYFESGKDGFTIPCGFRLFGGSTRGHSQKSFALKFRSMYGDGKLEYKVFDNRDYATFDTLVLRTSSQDTHRAIIRDILGTYLVDELTNAYVQAFKPIILYINGNYWGLYYIREKIDASYVENNFNTANPNSDVIRIDGDVTDGNKSFYHELLNYMENNDITDAKVYEKVKTMIDIDSFIDFWVAESFVTNNDIVNYRFFRNPEVDGGKFKFVFYDLDYAFYNYPNNYYLFFATSNAMHPYGETYYSSFLASTLMKNKEFRIRFVERVSYQLHNVWNTERVFAEEDKLLKILKPEFERHFKRWNINKDNYEASLEVFNNYIKQRGKYLIKHTKSFFNLSNEEYEKYFGDL